MSQVAGIDRSTDRTFGLQVVLAVASIAAGLIHAAVVREHLSEEWVFGVFFIIVAGFQMAWAVAVLFGPAALVYLTGAMTNGALIGIWIVSRTIGLPIGPDTWTPERLGTRDFAATILELLLVVGSLVLARRRGQAEGYDASRDRLGKEDRPCV